MLAAFIMRRTGTTWQLEQRIKPFPLGSSDCRRNTVDNSRSPRSQWYPGPRPTTPRSAQVGVRARAGVAIDTHEGPHRVCAVTRRRFPVGARPTRRFAPAGSNRSSHGGNEMAEAFD